MTAQTSARMRVGLPVGVALGIVGLYLVMSPAEVAEALARPYETAGQKINMRASWGGVVLGLGLFVAWARSLRPFRKLGLGAVMWLMIGIAVGRAVGFVLDGSPDALQWVWLIGELVIAAGCGWALRRDAGRSEAPA